MANSRLAVAAEKLWHIAGRPHSDEAVLQGCLIHRSQKVKVHLKRIGLLEAALFVPQLLVLFGTRLHLRLDGSGLLEAAELLLQSPADQIVNTPLFPDLVRTLLLQLQRLLFGIKKVHDVPGSEGVQLDLFSTSNSVIRCAVGSRAASIAAVSFSTVSSYSQCACLNHLARMLRTPPTDGSLLKFGVR